MPCPDRFPDAAPIATRAHLVPAIGKEQAMPEHPAAADTKPSHPVLLTPEQAARRLGISRWKLYDLLRRGTLVSLRIGSCRRIPAAAIDDLVAELLRDQSSSAV
jgi:excisionase family DNA binding protein